MDGRGAPACRKDESLLPASLLYRPADADPDCRFANRNRMFQGIPAVERTAGGRTFIAFYGGMSGEESGNFVVLFYCDDAGYDFGEPYLAVEAPTPACRCFDPCLWIDPEGRLWLFYAQSYTYIDGRLGVWACVCSEPDAGRPAFSAPRRISNGVMMNKPTVVSDGSWLLCCAIWSDELSVLNDLPDERFSNVVRSDDGGKSFRRVGRSDYPDRSTDEHMIVELRGGRLWMLIRGRHGIGQSFSDDGGYTWTDTGYSGIANPCSRFHIRRLKSGRLLLINHRGFTGQDQSSPKAGLGRNRLTAMLSEDDGRTWSEGLELDPRDEVSYPDMTQDSRGRMYIVYDRGRYSAREILLASVTEDDIAAGRTVSEGSFLRRVINRGGV